jgi:DNA (cytosine-5)-methyltransferase 1
VNKPTVISLFTGAGGLDLGFHAAGLRTAVAVEMDDDCCATLRANKSRAHPWEIIHDRVENVPSSRILAGGGLKPREADVLIGGPPCQPFSKSGYWARGDSGRLNDPRANTLWEYVRVLRDTLPKVFVLENVSGLAYTGKEEGLQFLLDEIRKVDAVKGTKYSVGLAQKVVNAADYGVPQTRERIVLVGHREGETFTFPKRAFFDPEDEDDATFVHGDNAWRTAWDALGDLGRPEDLDETKVTGRWAELLPSIPEGSNYNHFTERGDGSPIHLFGWRRRYWSFLLKLSKTRPSWTLTAQPGPAIGPFHWESRRLARRELLRLQTFPNDYDVSGSDVQRQVGNAVPSLLGEVLARAIRTQLLGMRPMSGALRLLPPQRPLPTPAHVTPAPLHPKYAGLVGEYSAHPGTGRGFAAMRRAAE